MRHEEVLCDGCGADLTVRTNSVDYRLVLGSESKPGRGAGVYTDMMIYPPVDRTYHFCDLSCLDRWRDHKNHYGKLMGERWNAWKEMHGSKSSDGRITSYPSPDKETSAQWRKECQAATDALFPLTTRAPKK